ncbi:hypothetical protein C8039_01050 [Halogeometricum sp. wsp3]|nr:hypothetical protein C8039_01050 [Halogeometricum sp. wsp3]
MNGDRVTTKAKSVTRCYSTTGRGRRSGTDSGIPRGRASSALSSPAGDSWRSGDAVSSQVVHTTPAVSDGYRTVSDRTTEPTATPDTQQ